MKRWPHEIKPYTPMEVYKYAVANPVWQAFRKSLKGLPTEEKLDKLHDWLHNVGPTSRRKQVQVDNYINALKRGGQLNEEGHVQK
jgi:hypothetical protein